MADASDLGTTALTLGQGLAGFQFFLPRLSDVRKADPVADLDMIGDVRLGEAAAVVYTLGVGIIASAVAKSPVPAYISAVMTIALICIYETALRRNRPGNPPVATRSTDA